MIAVAFAIGDDGIAGVGAGVVSSSRVRDLSLSVGVVTCGVTCCRGGEANAGFDGCDGGSNGMVDDVLGACGGEIGIGNGNVEGNFGSCRGVCGGES